MGLDEKALTRVGNLETAVKVDDMRAAGWTVAPPAKEADGLTWLRASKPFADAAGAAKVLNEINPAYFRDFAVTRESSLGRLSWTYRGTIDLTKGLDEFSDQELATALNSDRFGGNLEVIEKEEGKPATQMVDVKMTAQLPGGERQTFEPTFADPVPLKVDAETSKIQPIPVLPTAEGGAIPFVVLVVLVVVVIVGLVLLRRRFVLRR